MTGWDTRAQVGLRAPRGVSTSINPTHGVGGHYGGGGPFKRADHDACRAIARSWQDFHMSPSNSNNYNDIAYNLLVCHHDIVLEGRSTRSRPIVRGGANGNFTVNGNRYSVVAIWGANDGAWPDGLKRAWRYARDWLRDQDSRTGSGLTPHRDMSSTECPGGPGTAWLRAGAPLPTQLPEPEDDMTPEESKMLREIHGQVGSSITSVDGNKWRVRYAIERIWGRLHGDVHASTRATRTLVEGLAEGMDTEAIIQRIDAVADQAERQRTEILELVAAVGSGERNASEVVDEIGRRLRREGDG